ncbi:hypothetical protein ACFLWU_06515 [Chloroflexota bacterium]
MMTADNITSDDDRDKYLKSLGLRVSWEIINMIITVLRDKNESNLYELYASGQRRDGSYRIPVCGKGTVYKIKRLYEEGKFDCCLDYIDDRKLSVDIPEVDLNSIDEKVPENIIERDANSKLLEPGHGLEVSADSKPCLAPTPDNVDVAMLRSWGIPVKKAPEILFRWLSFHREGSHEMCKSFRNLEDDLRIRKIPFKQAEINLEVELWARKFEVHDALEAVELRRTYRSWENTHNFKAFIKEIEIKNQPVMEARERHLDELADRLIGWKANIEKALPENVYDTILDVRQDPLFESIMTHCFDISRAYEKIQLEKAFEHHDSNSINLKNTQSIHHLLKEIDRTLAKKTYRNQWCLNCTRNIAGSD